jgi:hypothetical protein
LLQLSAREIDRSLDDIEQIGNRYHGSPGEASCRDYIVERFAQIGLEQVRLEPFRYLAYEHEAASARIVSPEARALACRAVQYSASASAEGQAVYVGTGTGEDFQRIDRLGIDLTGKIVVAHSIAPFMVAPFLEGRGIAGLVNVGDTPDALVGNFTAALYRPPMAPPWEGRPVPWPGVTIEATAGRELISSLTGGRPVTVGVEHRARYVEKEASNVVGVIPGSAEGQVVVGGHYDSQADGPCVWDNGTGTASVIEIGRVLRDTRPQRSIVFVAFAVEEVGLWGSTAFTIEHAAEMGSIVGMVNLDAVASRYPAKHTVWTDEAMSDFAAESAGLQDWTIDIVFDARQFTFSDNTPFTDAGVPSCWVWEFPPIHPYYHSSGDTRELVDASLVAATAGVSAGIAQRLAADATLDLGRAATA